ncbi:MAG: tRNA (guanosine(37)-N1)-methyltransferase TrmD [Candidatus Omnitrophota bacterium]|nr:tRNA (guanosine(37)-N1)-methyltransferase TrmD [Candidatus Omnitrophota bacterium]
MWIDVITIFPEMFPAGVGVSILKRAQQERRLRINIHNLRDYTHDARRTIDDRPYGGGPGMVMKPEPIFEAVEAIRRASGHAAIPPHAGECLQVSPGRCHTILMSPQGERLSSTLAQQLAATAEHLIIICGHYEGVDERVRSALVSRAISIGDYILTGGELPAMVLIDCLARFLPGVIGHAQATQEESFTRGWLEYPQYTRPPVFRRMAVPQELLSGDHERIACWRRLQAVTRTLASRPDLAEVKSS